MLAPNGKPSNLTPEQYRLVRTTAFKKWFGDWENSPEKASKVVDENGEPMVCYHGTDKEFTEFKDFSKNDFGFLGVGFYFTNLKDWADAYSNNYQKTKGSTPHTKQVFLNIKKPYAWSKNDYVNDYDASFNYTNHLKSLGKDGVTWETYFTDEKRTYKEIVSFYPNQIKLADGTNTTFDSNNPDIRFDDGGEVSINEEQFGFVKIYLAKKEVGYISYDFNKGLLEIISFFIKSEYRNKGIGTIARKKLVELLKPKEIRGSVLSKQSLKSLIKTFGKPYYMGSVYKQYDDIDDAMNYLPDYTKVDEDDEEIQGGESDGIYYTIKKTKVKYNNGGSILLAPNGKPSNLTPEQYRLVRTPAFKAWFGDWINSPETASKVVDENGEPLVLNRGNLVIQEELGYTFNLGQNFLKKQSSNKFGFFFTNNIDIAKKYMLVDHFDEIRGGSITSVFMQSNKILDLLDFDLKIGQDDFIQGLIKKGINFNNGYNYLENKILDFNPDNYKYWGYNVFDYFDVFPELRNLFMENGFNSVIFYEMSRTYSKYKVYVAFESNQIKLADGTNTTFDGSNPDIRFDDGGSLEDGVGNNNVLEYLGFNNTEDITPIKINGRTVGGIDVTTYRGDTETLRVHKVLILPKFQGKGIGAKAINKLFRENPNVKQIIGNATAESKSFWQKIGAEFHSNEHTSFTITRNPDVRFEGGGNISKTPAPKKDKVYGSKINKPKSSESKSKAGSIILSPPVIKSINTILKEHNEDFPKKKVPLSTAKAVVRRGMGAFSSSYRPTISGGKPNSRVAWGLARLKAFVYKIQKGYSKSGKYKQDNDLIEELGYKYDEYKTGGEVVYHGSPYDFQEFTTSTIGTGEGASGWGYGLYFTEDKDEANDYACKLEREKKDGRIYTAKIPESEKFLDFHADFDEQTDYVKKALISMSKKYKIKLSEGEYQENLERINEDIDEYDFKIGDDDYWELINYVLEPHILFKQNYIYDWIKHILFEGYEYETSEFLYKLGIKGIKHSAFGYVNYVVFNDDDIKLLNKNIAKCRYKFGGEMEDNKTFILTTYFVSSETDTDSSNIYNGTDYERAKLEFDSANITDFDGGNGGMVLFQKVIDKYKFIGDLEDGYYEILDFPIEDYYNDKDYYKIIENGEFEHIDSKDVAHINKESDDLLHDIESYYQKTYGNWKYNKIIVDNGKDENDDDYKEYGCIQLRITNHSENVINNDKFGSCDYYISVVIANKNPTKDKFLTSMYERRRNEIELRFNSDNSFDEIINEIDSEIANGKLYIAEKLDISVNDIYKNGGGTTIRKPKIKSKDSNSKQTVYHGGHDIGSELILRTGYYGGKKTGVDSGAIFFTPSIKYANQYLKHKDGLYKYELEVTDNIFDGTNENHYLRLKDGFIKNWQDEYSSIEDAISDYENAVNSIKSSLSYGAIDWATGSQFLEQISNSGFEGIKFLERPAENIETNNETGEYELSGNPVYSYALFKDEIKVDRFGNGGQIKDLLSSQEVEDKLDRGLDLWNDDIVYLSGIKYKKVYLRPEYKRVI